MKKAALTSFILLSAIKSVSACSYAPGYDPPQLEKVDGIYFLSAFALIVPIVFLYYYRERKGGWAVIISTVSLILYIPAIIFTAFLFAMCGAFVGPVQLLIKAELFLMLLIFTIQLFSLIGQKKTGIKLQ
jgi:hypothetical protein